MKKLFVFASVFFPSVLFSLKCEPILHALSPSTTLAIHPNSAPQNAPLKIVMVSPEAEPFAKVGGLGDYVRGLAAALRAKGEGVSVIVPLYKAKKEEMIERFGITKLDVTLEFYVGKEKVELEVMTCELDGVRYYFLVHDLFFDAPYQDVGWGPTGVQKAVVLSRGAIELIQALDLKPDVLHTNDWMSALVPTFLKTDPRYSKDTSLQGTRTLHTLHNVGWAYQGSFARMWHEKGRIVDLFSYLNLSEEHYFGLRFFAGDFWKENDELIGEPRLFDLWRRPASLVENPSGLGQGKLIDLFLKDPPGMWSLNLTAGAVGLHADQIVTVSDTFLEETLAHENAHGLEVLLSARDKLGQYHAIINGSNVEKLTAILKRLGGKEKAKRALMGSRPELEEYLDIVLPLDSTLSKERREKVLAERQKFIDYLAAKPRLNEKVPLLGMVARLTAQKGMDLVAARMESLLREHEELHFIYTGTPSPDSSEEVAWSKKLERLNELFPDRVRVVIAFNGYLADLVTIGSDMFLMPSRFEPCGITQLNAMAVGTLPIVRATGGLADTVIDYRRPDGTGFLFRKDHSEAMAHAIHNALSVYHNAPDWWRRLMANAQRLGYTWSKAAGEYSNLYRRMRGEFKLREVITREFQDVHVFFPLPSSQVRESDLWRYHEHPLIREFRQMEGRTDNVFKVTLPAKTLEILSPQIGFLVLLSPATSNMSQQILMSDVDTYEGVALVVRGECPATNEKFVAIVWDSPDRFLESAEQLLAFLQRKRAEVQEATFGMGGHSGRLVPFTPPNIPALRKEIHGKMGTRHLSNLADGCSSNHWGYLIPCQDRATLHTFGLRPYESQRSAEYYDYAI